MAEVEITPLPCFIMLHNDPKKSSYTEEDPLAAYYSLEDPPVAHDRRERNVRP